MVRHDYNDTQREHCRHQPNHALPGSRVGNQSMSAGQRDRTPAEFFDFAI